MPRDFTAPSEMACPKCAAIPFDTHDLNIDKISDLVELIGHSCVRCGYEVVEEDVEVAIVAALERLLLRRAGAIKVSD
ncbi:hypothetical protein SFA35_10055 [Pseudomonas sp. HR96]|uniref:hypothetical protein n=1 Tax=Pseudomonas sp. HR96 TaxID=1027966 RepID=UPI002A74C373|nr:hypothetical protein [Pseudomonas sp. HR96]WPP01658.1 hypothetical protein SFA35_10055 [Pseudomonas sp. HR96]